ncbi:DUF3592 domain-containing protein [Arcicella rosea]|uniref:DUF3592 domain-containing protein n=1 Tax=Arcicella rosea TaxID=502909 RepID=A0A841EMI9_9BACT|nr:DUF3592 domain-containing protein [Arcicella rosea]MBB6005337.1 hypothetical protein [Arcicella rosea]
MESAFNSILLISGPHGVYEGVPPLVMAGFILVAGALIFLGIYLSKKRRDWLQHSVLTNGEVVEVSKRYERSDKLGQSPIFFPVVSFSVNGRQFKIEADKGMSMLSQVGQTMQVRYNPENPYDSALGERSIPGLNPSVFLILGIVLLCTSAMLMF